MHRLTLVWIVMLSAVAVTPPCVALPSATTWHCDLWEECTALQRARYTPGFVIDKKSDFNRIPASSSHVEFREYEDQWNENGALRLPSSIQVVSIKCSPSTNLLCWLAKIGAENVQVIFLECDAITEQDVTELSSLKRLKHMALSCGSMDVAVALDRVAANCPDLSVMELECPDLDRMVTGLHTFNSVEAIRIATVSELAESTCQHLARIEALRTLDVRSSRLSDRAWHALARLTELQSLAIPGHYRFCDNVLKAVGAMHHLTKLFIGGGVIDLCELGRVSPGLRQLHLRGKVVGGDSEQLAAWKLNVLDCSFAMFDESGLEAIAKARQMHTLLLGNARGIRIAKLSEALSQMKELVVLDVAYINCASREALGVLIDGIHTVRYLRLDGCALSDEDMSRLALGKRWRLNKLSMRTCVGLSEKGISCLASCEELEYLDVGGLKGVESTILGDVVVKLLFLVELGISGWVSFPVEHLTTLVSVGCLRYVDVRGCHIGSSQLDDIAVSNPDIVFES